MADYSALCGWVQNDAAKAAFSAQLEAEQPGYRARFADAHPDLRGFHKQSHGIFLFEAEKALRIVCGDGSVKEAGTTFKADHQARGTCFPAGSLVRMADGTEKAIEQIRTGELVLTHTGKPRRVLAVGSRTYSGYLHTLRMKGWLDAVSMTDEHPVGHYPNVPRQRKLRSDAGRRKRRKYIPAQLQWTAADQLQPADRVLLPLPEYGPQEHLLDMAEFLETDDVVRIFKKPTVSAEYVRKKHAKDTVKRMIPLTPALGRLLGLYLAEGSCEARRLTWTLCGTETDVAAEIQELLFDIFGVGSCLVPPQVDGPNTLRVRCDNATLAAIFKKLCPGNVYTKRVPGLLLTSTHDVRMAVLRGWMAGDGHEDVEKYDSGTCVQTRASVTGVTASYGLARDMANLALSCRLMPTAYQRHEKKHDKQAFVVELYGDDVATLCPALADSVTRAHFVMKTPRQQFWHETGLVKKISSITRLAVQNIQVYNLEVAEDHSYIVGGLAVHNCVGRGTYKAAQDAYLWPIYKGLVMAEPKQLSYELIYGGSRSMPDIGGGSLGGGDGSNGSWAAKFIHDYGLLPRGNYGNYDLRTSNEMLAVRLGAPGARIDPEVLALCKQHRVFVAHRCDTIEEMADVLAAGGGIAFCSGVIWGNRNQNGMARPSGSGGHCEAVRGYFWTPEGELSFVRQQSWGDAPGGPSTLVHKFGTVELPQGAYGAYGRDVAAALNRGGEAWGFTSVQGWTLSGSIGDHI